ncbi:MAG: apolipoprotein N-acyltransferase, partial [Syntrophales bacterium LBB04]|nr:apolipoprotein N-acyltransferase [Syntrophales bacterium LBB04]
AILPEASRMHKKMGAQLLVNITNDAWFGYSSAPYQHLSMAVFRTIEDRLYLVRAANTGISAIVDPTGKILDRTELFVRSALRGSVRFIDSATYYVTYGDTFAYLCFVGLILVVITAGKRGKKCWKI